MTRGYDPVELRRRIAVCLSAAEIQRLGGELGASIAVDRGAESAARDLVKEIEKRGALADLVARLRETQPLVEWPEPVEGVAPPPSKPAVQFIPASVAPPPMPVPPTITGDAAPSESPPSSRREPPKQVPALPVWPGTTVVAPQTSKGVDPKIFIVVSALMVIAAIVAYVAGRASTGPSASGPAASASASSARRSLGPATEAADAMARGVGHVARVCEVAPGSAPDVFRRAFDRCGPVPPPPRPTSTTVADPDLPPLVDDPARDQAQLRIPRTRDPSTPTNGCVASCDATHRGCRTRCGPEPTQGSQYGEYQQCLGRCLSVASKCRLGCP